LLLLPCAGVVVGTAFAFRGPPANERPGGRRPPSSPRHARLCRLSSKEGGDGAVDDGDDKRGYRIADLTKNLIGSRVEKVRSLVRRRFACEPNKCSNLS